ncbi:hypothetical protein GW17_00061539 [Ensete ventricosum]|nr:hypothetical protein GW17_00061539 [Ensete ventricosum]
MWTCHDIDNSPPFLSKEVAKVVVHLRGIQSSSKAIKSMSEDWSVEASLSATPRGMGQGSIKGQDLPSPENGRGWKLNKMGLVAMAIADAWVYEVTQQLEEIKSQLESKHQEKEARGRIQVMEAQLQGLGLDPDVT